MRRYAVTIQMRKYTVHPGKMDEFAAAWMEHVYPLRFKHGFTVEQAGVLDDSDDFVCVITDNSEGDWDTKESAYYASEEHAVLEPILAPLIAGGEVWFVNSVVPSD